MTFLNLTRREAKLFFAVLILILFWTAQRFVIKPISGRFKELDGKIESSALNLEKGRRILGKQDKIRLEYESYASSVKMTGTEEEEMAKFLTEIEKLAQSSSVHISDIKPRPVKRLEFYNKCLVELDAEGDIKQVSKFIYDVQNSPQLLKIDKFSLGTKAATTNLLKCRILVSKVLIP